MPPVLSTWQMALSTSSPQSLCYQQVSAPFSWLWKSCLATERLPWGFVLSRRVLLCFVSLWMETIQRCFWHSLSFCLCFLLLCAPFFGTFCSLPVWVVLRRRHKRGRGAPEQMWEDRNCPGLRLFLPELDCTFSDASDEQNLSSSCRKTWLSQALNFGFVLALYQSKWGV